MFRNIKILTKLINTLFLKKSENETFGSCCLYIGCSSSASKYNSDPVIERVPGTTIPGAIKRPKVLYAASSKVQHLKEYES